MGGMKAVIWADVFQAFVIICGMFAIVIQGVLNIGGLAKIWEISDKGGRLEMFNFDPDPTQRLSFLVTDNSLTEAQRSVYLNIPGLLIINALAGLVGLVVYAHYAAVNCDPLRAGYITNSNQLLPYYMVDVLNFPGFPGIFLAVLFSGALSSITSSLNSVATVTWEDIAKTFFSHLSEAGKANVTRILVVCYGAIGLLAALLADRLGGHVLQASISFTGALAGPIFGMFLLGAIFPSANAKGAAIGSVASMSLSLWIIMGAFIVRPYRATLPTSVSNCWNTSSDLHNMSIAVYNHSLPTTASTQHTTLEGVERLYGLSFLWYGAVGSAVTVLVGLLVSSCTESDTEKVDPALIIPLSDRLCCCLPSRWQHKLQWKRHQLDEREEQEAMKRKQQMETPESLPFMLQALASSKEQSSTGQTSQHAKAYDVACKNTD
ncbi:Sodium-coupled monocarboxylate transporter 1 [Lamellibrachia satsuma]|nr:Sodium-coupled monocarboxylate transporter 1 [Lamellibrachia satsuma]